MLFDACAGLLESPAKLGGPEKILEPVERPQAERRCCSHGPLPQTVGRRNHEVTAGLHDAVKLEDGRLRIRRVLDGFARQYRIKGIRRATESTDGADYRIAA